MAVEYKDLDVRPILEAGVEPFAEIMASVNALAPDQGLRLIAPFKPQPLFSVMARKGFRHEVVELEHGYFEVRFLPETIAVRASDDADGAEAWPDPAMELDLTELDPPQPMLRILQTLETLPKGAVLFAALGRNDYPGTALTVTESLAMSWPTEAWLQFIDRSPHLAVSALNTIGQRLEEAHTRIREMSTEEVERRVAHTVLRLSQQAGKKADNGVRIDFPITRQDIAEMTGTTLHTVSRILSAWESKGLVEGGRQKLLVRDVKGLQTLADAADR